MSRSWIRLIAITVLVAAGTWVAGWWAVPLVGLIAGLLRWNPAIAALGSALGWAVLLLIDTLAGDMSRLATVLGDVMGLPPAALIAVTLLFPALLGWSTTVIAAVILSEAKERVSPSLRSG